MKERFLEVSQEADRRQQERFQIWLKGEGIPFADERAQAAYRERVTLLKEAIQMKQRPARIPVCPSAGFFPMQYGGISMYVAMYDYRALAIRRLHLSAVLRYNSVAARLPMRTSRPLMR